MTGLRRKSVSENNTFNTLMLPEGRRMFWKDHFVHTLTHSLQPSGQGQEHRWTAHQRQSTGPLISSSMWSIPFLCIEHLSNHCCLLQDVSFCCCIWYECLFILNCPYVTILPCVVHLFSKVRKTAFHSWVLTLRILWVLTDTVRFRELRGGHLNIFASFMSVFIDLQV